MTPAEPVGRLRREPLFWIERYQAWTVPTKQDLPNWRVLAAFPIVLAIVGIVLIGSAINGSSSGQLYSAVYEGRDPSLLAGHPQAIRSDEWNVGTVWTIAQAQQGFPERSQTFPGGMDAALPYDLPRSGPSVAFRPHLVGFLFLDVDHGTAWRWWVPGLILMAAGYCFVVTVVPRRPLMAACLSIGFYLSPFIQWWYQSTTLWPLAWGLATMGALAWAAKARRWRGTVVWAMSTAYLSIVMAMGIYAPFIIPVVLVVLFYGVGLLLHRLRSGERLAKTIGSFAPVLAAGGLAAGITGAWLLTKAKTVDQFLNTVYPGQRLTAAGTDGPVIALRTIGSAFTESLETAKGFLGTNSSEASTFFLVGAFLLPVAVWAIARQLRSRSTLPWVLIGLGAVTVVFATFVLVPGWDPIARLLLLDRSTPDRVRIGLGLASFGLLIYVIRYLDDRGVRAPRLTSSFAALAFVTSQVLIAAAITTTLGADRLWDATPSWLPVTLLSAGTIYLFARRRFRWATALFIVITIAGGALVNPVYVGVFDLRETALGKAIVEVDEQDPGTWIGVGASVVAGTVIESGVRALNGTQGAPSTEMWSQIDPSGQYQTQWNRIGGVSWSIGEGEPVVTNPAPDQLLVTVDFCSEFAAKYVTYVVTDRVIPSNCLTEERSEAAPTGHFRIYRVTSR